MFTKIIVFFSENKYKRKSTLKSYRVTLLFIFLFSFAAGAIAAPPAFLLENASKAKNSLWADVIVSGKVTNSNGDPLAGATVFVQGNNNRATKTDGDGLFTLSVPDNAVLVVSFVGYTSANETVNGRTVINFTLTQLDAKLDEVVVIGYGTANKRDLTGSIAKVSGKEVADKPNTNPVASLQSKVAGLSVVNNGTPGSAPDVRIRGTISIGSVSPLYVVDGVFNDNINYINPNDIESIEILKDPSSLAIFGVRGAAGVIAITTKKAKAGQMIINFNSTVGFKKLTDKIQLADTGLFRTLYEEEKANIGITSPFDYSKFNSNTDWIDAVTRTGFYNANNISLSSSTQKNKFNMGAGYTTDEGIVKREKLEKIQFSFNDELTLNKVLKVGFNFNGVRTDAPFSGGFLDQARKVIPFVSAGTIPVYVKNPYGPDSLNQNIYYALPSIQNSGVVNPLVEIENEYNTTINREYRTVASVFGELQIVKDLSLRSTVYADISNVNYRHYEPLYYAYDVEGGTPYLEGKTTSVNESDDTYRKFQQDHILNYKKKVGAHSFNATAGFTTYYFSHFGRSGSVKQSATGDPIPNDKRFWYISNGFGDALSQKSSSSQNERSTVSGLFRLLYNYQNKYFINGSYRKDASSQISPNNRWQDFWAVGAAWDLSKENFMSTQKTFDYLKLKGSIGVLGNQNTYGYDYPYYPSLRSGEAAVFGDLVYNAYSQAYLPNPNLKWETVLASEVGVEMVLLDNRLNVEANYFNKKTRDLMTFIPGVNGVANGLDNIGSIRNSGIELAAGWKQKVNDDFSFTVSGNLTTYKNKVLELATKEFSISSGLSRTTVGLPIGYFYGYIVEGIYQTTADILTSPENAVFSSYGVGDFKYKDITGDGKITTDDRTIIGNPTPDFTYGGSINFQYKGLDLGVDVGGVYGNEIYRNWGGTETPFQRVNYAAFKVNRWNGEGTSNWDPILAQSHRINYEPSTYGIEDGSYFRIRNVQLGYNFGQSLISRAKIKNLRAFANVQNLKTWKNNSGYTTEYGGDALSFGVDNAGGAIPMVTTFGVNVTF